VIRLGLRNPRQKERKREVEEWCGPWCSDPTMYYLLTRLSFSLTRVSTLGYLELRGPTTENIIYPDFTVSLALQRSMKGCQKISPSRNPWQTEFKWRATWCGRRSVDGAVHARRQLVWHYSKLAGSEITRKARAHSPAASHATGSGVFCL